MSYVQTILQPNEQLLFETRVHWLIYLPGALLLIAAAVIAAVGHFVAGGGTPSLAAYAAAALLLLLALLALAAEWIRRQSTEIAVTDRRVIFKRGVIRRHTIEMNMDKVESVDVDQSILGRLFNFGTIVIHGTGSDVEPLHGIEDPLRFRSYVTAR